MRHPTRRFAIVALLAGLAGSGSMLWSGCENVSVGISDRPDDGSLRPEDESKEGARKKEERGVQPGDPSPWR